MTFLHQDASPSIAGLPIQTIAFEQVRSVRAGIGTRTVSEAAVVPMQMRIARAVAPVDMITCVRTDPGFRRRGYCRQVMQAAVSHMRAGPAAMSVLHGIAGFYHRFGYVPCIPDRMISLPPNKAEPVLPAGWRFRPMQQRDLPQVQGIFNQNTALASGAVVRGDDAWAWRMLRRTWAADAEDACQVLVDETGQLRGYAWIGTSLWGWRKMTRANPHWFIVAEAMATDARSGELVLAMCRKWATHPRDPLLPPTQSLVLSLPASGPVASAAMHAGGTCNATFCSDGDLMAIVLETNRLMTAMRPELDQRAQVLDEAPVALHLVCDSGNCSLSVSRGRVTILREPPPESLRITMDHATLVRLVWGAYDPGDLLSRALPSLDARARELLRVLFPQGRPHIYLADRAA